MIFNINNQPNYTNFFKTHQEWLSSSLDKDVRKTAKSDDYRKFVDSAISQNDLDSIMNVDDGVDENIKISSINNGYKENNQMIQDMLKTINKNLVAESERTYDTDHPVISNDGIKKARITYDIVDEESAEHGEPKESGFLDDEGVVIWEPGDEESSIDAAVKFLKRQGAVNGSDSVVARWWTTNEDIDYRTGERETKSYHLVGYSTEQLEEITEKMK